MSNATQTSLNATSDYDQSYVVINNTIPGYANMDVKFYVDDALYTNKTANATGFISFNYTGAWSSHTFKWVVNFPRYDINKDGMVNILDLNYIGQHFNEVTVSSYPDYDVDESGKVDGADFLNVSLYFGEITV
ncbi:MAG: dockerin type I domain-containing protein [Candidatus Methanoperedens sp.]|nr:dockerin type I domain-containing protein [Candidatus Methanoperedens sp.]